MRCFVFPSSSGEGEEDEAGAARPATSESGSVDDDDPSKLAATSLTKVDRSHIIVWQVTQN